CLPIAAGAFRPVKMVACPVALWGRPATPSVASVASSRVDSAGRPTARRVRDLPPNRRSRWGVGKANQGLSDASSPRPTPAINNMITDILLSSSPRTLPIYITTVYAGLEEYRSI